MFRLTLLAESISPRAQTWDVRKRPKTFTAMTSKRAFMGIKPEHGQPETEYRYQHDRALEIIM